MIQHLKKKEGNQRERKERQKEDRGNTRKESKTTAAINGYSSGVNNKEPTSRRDRHTHTHKTKSNREYTV